MLICGIPVIAGLAYLLWSPGRIVTDGSHDRQTNGLWISHGWLGDDAWFTGHSRRDTLPPFREPSYVAEQVAHWREHNISDLFPHLAPTGHDGTLPGVDPQQVERFLDAAPDMRVLPWIGGVHTRDIRADDPAWRETFVADVRRLLDAHPRLAGIHLNVEPWPSGDRDMLILLDALNAALADDEVLSIAAYPPPTRWHPHADVHWDETYFRQIASRCDHMAVMMYDTSLRWQKPYRKLMADWTQEVIAWSGNTPVLLGVPAYEDTGVDYHHPHVENIQNALQGMHAGLAQFEQLPTNYQGIAIYSGWTLDEDEWDVLRTHFLSRK